MSARQEDRTAGYRTNQIMCVPIRLEASQPAILGVLHLVNHRTGGPFSNEAIEMVQAFASQIALAVAAVQLSDTEKSIKMTRFVKRYNNVHMNKAWNQWYTIYSNARRLRNLQAKAVKMMRNRYLSKAYLTWCSYYLSRKRQRELTKRIISRLLNNLLHRGFQRWCHFNLRSQIAGDAKDLYLQLQLIKQQHQEDVINKAVRRISNRRLASAYHAWWAKYDAGMFQN
jgi:hypothetical protein